MLAGISGRLITTSFVREQFWECGGSGPVPADAGRALASWSERLESALGPASSVRAIAETAVVPFVRLLGYAVEARQEGGDSCAIDLSHAGRVTAGVIVGPWRTSLDTLWRPAIRAAIARNRRWWFCCNGATLRIVDAHRTWARESLDLDLLVAPRDPESLRLLWALVRAEALDASRPALDEAVDASARHGVSVCRALGAGVIDALNLLLAALAGRNRHAPPPRLLDQSLTVVYRILFLLFAEARGLVPIWHPVYRDRYSLEAIVGAVSSGQPYRGVWEAIQAITRMAHQGCLAGELRVTAFNGRLFAPAAAAAFDARRLDDRTMSQAIAAVSTTGGGARRRARIAYRELDVEQLGAVYERVLDFEPAGGTGVPLRRTREARKSSGTFYTPRRVTAFVVRHTLEPLVRDRSADGILGLRVLDPAMGSGAFLVAACRFLAEAAEAALVREGRWHPADITSADRAALGRDIASRCLFGVDVNPTAVQLARLSLWLATLAAGKPLSFLDHHLVSGDSLVGAAPHDVRRQPGGTRNGTRHRPLPLFPDEPLHVALQAAVGVRLRLATEPDSTPAVVRAKERALATLSGDASPLGRWSRVLDLWCAGWFWDAAPGHSAPPAPPPPDRAVFQDLMSQVLNGGSSLPRPLAARYLDHAAAVARDQRFLHWPLAFPEVFAGADGVPLADGGFDAVLGNPPWDMVRGDLGDADARRRRAGQARRLGGFVRDSGVYHVGSRAHVNRYQLFVERGLQLVRRGGRIGLVLPAGVAGDAGAAALRRHLFDHADVDAVTGLDNRHGIFPIHRGVRFVLLTGTAGRPTTTLACRFGIRDLDAMDGDANPIHLTRAFLARVSGGDDLGIPELATPSDLRIVERIAATIPRLGADDGWHVTFGRELNASDDRAALAVRGTRNGARPVVEGKHLEPFRVALDRCAWEISPAADGRVPRRARLAYRDVASATNRLTLIAAIVPAHGVTTHTLFCLKTPLPAAAQHVLGALLNSFVANYLVRLRVNTHVTAALMSRLPVPLVRADDEAFDTLHHLAARLAEAGPPPEDRPDYARLQAIAARLYGLTRTDLEHVLGTFPLIPSEVKERVLAAFAGSH
jgi:hypothetical protein